MPSPIKAFRLPRSGASDGIFVYSVRLNEDVRLLDLLDLSDDEPAFRELGLEVALDDRTGSADPAVWWNNALVMTPASELGMAHDLENLDEDDVYLRPKVAIYSCQEGLCSEPDPRSMEIARCR